MTITEFLEARIAADERAIMKLAEADRRPLLSISITVNHPQRLLAECAAKRAIIETQSVPKIAAVPSPFILRALASVYADHPDYRQEWAL
jgi:hypothetical protein